MSEEDEKKQSVEFTPEELAFLHTNIDNMVMQGKKDQLVRLMSIQGSVLYKLELLMKKEQK
jgi:hypothetical protein